jgi:hypothetical protein
MSAFGGGGPTLLICPTPDFDYIWYGTFRTSAKI